MQNYFLKKYFLQAFKNSFILSFFTAIIVTFSGLIISILLVNSRNNLFLQQILFLISSMILVISPIIISLGYFIVLGELRYVSFITFAVIIIINCLFLIPFSILILFTKLKNIFLNFDDIKNYQTQNNKSVIKQIIAKDDVWIEIKDFNENILISTILKKDEFFKLPNDGSEVIISASNAGSLFLKDGNNNYTGLGSSGDILDSIQLISLITNH